VSVNADIPWFKVDASFNPSLPNLDSGGFLSPSVEVVNPPRSSKAVKSNSAKSAQAALAASQATMDPCSLTAKPDQPALADVEAVGYASINAQKGDDLSQRRLLAARASRLDAYRSLVEQVYGVQFSTDSAMLNTRLGEDTFHTRMEGSMCGATIVSIEPLGDDLYETRLRLPGVVAAGLRAHGKTAAL
jgi:hypothetical protein